MEGKFVHDGEKPKQNPKQNEPEIGAEMKDWVMFDQC